MSDIDGIPDLVAECEIDSDEDDDAWEEMEEQKENTKCLFCDKIENSIEVVIDHLAEAHQFILSNLKAKFLMDQYSFIKMVNYIRLNKITNPDEISSASTIIWNDEKYLKPVNYESWLTYDYENIKVPESSSSTEPNYFKIIKELEQKLKEKDDMLEQAASDIETMRKSFVNLLSKEEPLNKSNTKTNEPRPKVENGVGSVPLIEDEGYFSSYSHFGIHHSMLSDKIRTESYRDAILKNSSVIKDKIVLDLGCGTSILSMFASQAGAKEVYAIDQSEIIYKAMEIVNTNGIKNINFVKNRLEDAPLPVEKVDIIISEWMGYFLLFEGMLDSVIYARKNYLKEGGILMPNRCNISLVGYGDQANYQHYIEFWQSVYNFDMTCMVKEILREAHVELCNKESVLTSPNVLVDLDLMTVDLNCPDFSYDFALETVKDGPLTAFVGYFDTFFELPEHVMFSTSPFATPTHWKQVLFYLDQRYEQKVGDIIKGKFICRRDREDLRSLKVVIEVFGKTFKYALN